ncbi:MAG: hypothetical protein FJ207_01280 [Gemmatimonadetes bacterium]|nr:hypothetical protein [Gemmatimonadota bacterium]
MLVAGTLSISAATGAEAQLGDVAAAFYGGMAFPVGEFADYATAGVTGGVEVEMPILDPVDIVARGELEHLNGGVPGMPDVTLWRYQAGVSADLLGQPDESWGLKGFLGAGGATLRSGAFYVPGGGPDLQSVGQTSLTGTAGLELVFGASSPIHGYLGARLQWMRLNRDDMESLGTASLGGPLDPIESAISLPVTLGLRIRTS